MNSPLSDQDYQQFLRSPEAFLAPLGGAASRVPPGARVLLQGEPVDHLWCVLAGRLKVEASEWGDRTLLVCFAGPGAFFGEVEVFRDEHRSVCTLTAVTESRLWRIDRGRLRAGLVRWPWMGGLLARTLADKVADRAREAARNQLWPLEDRYLDYLVQMGAGSSPRPIDLADTAALLAVSPRHLQRVIRSLVSRGLVHRQGRSLLVDRSAEDYLTVRRTL